MKKLIIFDLFKDSMERKFAETRFGRISYLYREGNEPIIALHGIGSSAESFAKLEKYLDKRFELYFLDLLGHGMSSKNEMEYTIGNQCLALDDFIKLLGKKDFTLMGNSYGGWLSLRYTLDHSQPKNLVLISNAGLHPVGKMSENDINNFVDFLIKSNSKNDPKILKNTIKNNQNPIWRLKLEDLKKIKSKTLIVWGKNDNVMDIKYAEIIASNIENSKLFLIDAGHMPQFEEPEEFSKIINENL